MAGEMHLFACHVSQVAFKAKFSLNAIVLCLSLSLSDWRAFREDVFAAKSLRIHFQKLQLSSTFPSESDRSNVQKEAQRALFAKRDLNLEAKRCSQLALGDDGDGEPARSDAKYGR